MPRPLSGHTCRFAVLALVGAPGWWPPRSRVDPGRTGTLAAAYVDHIRPLLTTYCRKCTRGRAGSGLDLDRFATLTDVKKATRVW